MKGVNVFSVLLFGVVLVFGGCGGSSTGIKFYEEAQKHQIENQKDIHLRLDAHGHSGQVREVSIVNKDEIITASTDKTIRIWDVKSGKEKRRFLPYIQDGAEGVILAMALSPDKKYLAVTGNLSLTKNGFIDHKIAIQIFDYKSGKIIHTLDSHAAKLNELKFTSDSKYLILSGQKIHIWSIPTFKYYKKYDYTHGGIYNIAVTNNNGDNILFLNDGATSYIVSIEKGLLAKKKTYLQSKYMATNGNHIAVSSIISNSIIIFDMNFNLVKTIKTTNQSSESCNLSYSNNGKLLVYGACKQPYVARVYNVEKDYMLQSHFDKHSGRTWDIEAYDDVVVSTGDNNGEVYVWNAYDGKLIQSMRSQGTVISDLGVKATKLGWGNVFNSNTHTPKISYAFDIEKNLYCDTNGSEFIKNLEWYYDGNKKSGHKIVSELPKNYKNFSLVRHKNHKVLYLDKHGKQQAYFPADHTNGTYHSVYGFYNGYIVSGGKNGWITVYNPEDYKLVAIVGGHEGDVTSLATDGEYLYTGSQDQRIRIYKFLNIKQTQEKMFKFIDPLATLFVGKDKEWIMWTNEGYFKASSSGAKYVGYHLNHGINKEASWISVDKLYDHFFRPDLVKLKLQGVDISEFTNGLTYEEVLKTPPPSVSLKEVVKKDIDTKNRTVKISFNVKGNDGGGVGVIRIYQEGKLVKTIGEGKINRVVANADKKLQEEKLNELSKQKQKEYLAQLEVSASKSISGTLENSELVGDVELEEVTNKEGEFIVTLPVKAGKNSISIEAFNKTNTVASYRETVEVNAKVKKRKPKIYVIAAGVNEFEQNNVSKLKYSENDAKTIAKEIKNATEYKTEVTLLTGKKVTKANILKAIKSVKKKAHLEDKIVFYISTHGKAARGRLYLVPQNNKSLKNWINFEEVFKEIQAVNALDQIFIIDACESGQASDIMSSVYDAKASVLAKQSGVHLLMATTKGTFAFESADKNVKHGVFTNNILEALNSKTTDKNKNKKISIVELSKTLKEPKYGVEHQFPIIRNVGEDTYIKKVK